MVRIRNFVRSYLTPAEQNILFFLLITGIIGIGVHYTGLEAESEGLDSLRVIIREPAQPRYDINTVTERELQTIPGIGIVRAQAIIEYRDENRPIVVDDLINVRGIGEITLGRIRGYFGEDSLINGKFDETETTVRVATIDPTTMININEATLEDLMQVSGIGQVRGESIISFINEQGRIKNIDHLQEIRGIGPKTLENIKEKFYADNGR